MGSLHKDEWMMYPLCAGVLATPQSIRSTTIVSTSLDWLQLSDQISWNWHVFLWPELVAQVELIMSWFARFMSLLNITKKRPTTWIQVSKWYLKGKKTLPKKIIHRRPCKSNLRTCLSILGVWIQTGGQKLFSKFPAMSQSEIYVSQTIKKHAVFHPLHL